MTRLEDKLPKWRRRLERVDRDLRDLSRVREVYRQLLKVVSANAQINQPNVLFWYLEHTHAQTLLVGIRRHVDRDKSTASLAALIRDISQDSPLLTRSRHVELTGSQDAWRSLIGSDDETCPAKIIESHLSQLDELRETIGAFVDKRIAHLEDTKQIPQAGLFDDLWRALDDLICLSSHYASLVDPSYVRLNAYVDPAWADVLNAAWIRPSHDAQR